MIEVARAKDDQYGLKWQGRWICSSVSPQKEAASWVRSHSRQLQHLECAIVLGLGCGYHVLELKRKYPQLKVLVVEHSEAIMMHTLQQHSLDIAREEILLVADDKELMASVQLKRFLALPYTVLKFSPATHTNPSFYAAAEEFALGRTELGFRAIAAARPEVCKQLHLEQLRVVADELISIKTIERLTTGHALNPWIHLSRALREIVN